MLSRVSSTLVILPSPSPLFLIDIVYVIVELTLVVPSFIHCSIPDFRITRPAGKHVHAL